MRLYFILILTYNCAEIIAETVVDVCSKFPWPKSMRWGSSPFQWVRPLQSVLCLLGGKVVPFEIAGLHSGAETRGHRFLGPETFKVKDFADYQASLERHHVMLDPARLRIGLVGRGDLAIRRLGWFQKLGAKPEIFSDKPSVESRLNHSVPMTMV